MKSKDDNLLYMETKLLEAYVPYSHNELQIIYRFFKEFQKTNDLNLKISYQEIREMFFCEDNIFYDIICRLIASAPSRPFWIGTDEGRELFYFLKSGVVDRQDGVIYVVLDEKIKDYVKPIEKLDDPVVLNLDIIRKFISKKDRFCDEIKIYEGISCEFNKIQGDDTLYIPFAIDEIYFRSSVFEWFEKKYRDEYLKGNDILNMAKEVCIDKGYKTQRYMWYIFSRSFIFKTIDIINNNTDIFIEGYSPIKFGHLTTGIIFKVRRNTNVSDLKYLDKVNHKITAEEKEYQHKCEHIYTKP